MNRELEENFNTRFFNIKSSPINASDRNDNNNKITKTGKFGLFSIDNILSTLEPHPKLNYQTKQNITTAIKPSSKKIFKLKTYLGQIF